MGIEEVRKYGKRAIPELVNKMTKVIAEPYQPLDTRMPVFTGEDGEIHRTKNTIDEDGNMSIYGFTKLGSSSQQIKMETRFGTFSTSNGGTAVLTVPGIPYTDILSIDVIGIVKYDYVVGQNSRKYGCQFDVYFKPGSSYQLRIHNQYNNCSYLYGKPFKATIIYKKGN